VEIGPYEVLDELGRGGMGRVYLARHRPTGAKRALKALEGVPDLEYLDRFRREVEALARLGGAGVVPVHDSGAAGRVLWFAMDLMPGGSLRARLKQRGTLPWREAVEVVAPIAHALGRGHAIGLVHRDVKPENILFDDQGAPRLADFGCVRDLAAPALTATGAWIGTPGYMAPEQLEGKRIGPPGDVFALGVVLYELLQGERPYDARTVLELALVTAKGKRKPLGDVPEELRSIVDRALESNAEARTPNGTRLAKELDALLAGRSAAPRSRRGLALAIPVLLAAALALGLWLRSPRPPARPIAAAPAHPTSATPTKTSDLTRRIEEWTRRGTRIPVAELALAAREEPDPENRIAHAAFELGIDGDSLTPELVTLLSRERSPLAPALRAVAVVGPALATEAGRRGVREILDRNWKTDDSTLKQSWMTLTEDTRLAKAYPAVVAPILSGLEALAHEEVQASLTPIGPDATAVLKALASCWASVTGLPDGLNGLLAVAVKPEQQRPDPGLARIAALIRASDVFESRGELSLALSLRSAAVRTARTIQVRPAGLDDLVARIARLGTQAGDGLPPGPERSLVFGVVVSADVDSGIFSSSPKWSLERLTHAYGIAVREGMSEETRTTTGRWLVGQLLTMKLWARVDELVPDPPRGLLPEVLCARACSLSDAGEAKKAAATLGEARELAAALAADPLRSADLDLAARYLAAKK
jgi:serine/threonine protein kinase